MNRDQWRDLQRSLHPKDLVTVQTFAECLARNVPFVHVTDGIRSACVEGPGVLGLAQDMLADLWAGPQSSAFASSSGPLQ